MRKKNWLILLVCAAFLIFLAWLLPSAGWKLHQKQLEKERTMATYDRSRTNTPLTPQMVSDIVYTASRDPFMETTSPEELEAKQAEVDQLLKQFIDAASEDAQDYIAELLQEGRLTYYFEQPMIGKVGDSILSIDMASCELAFAREEISASVSVTFERKTQTIMSFAFFPVDDEHLPFKTDLITDTATRYYQNIGIPTDRYQFAFEEHSFQISLVQAGDQGDTISDP